MIRAARSLGALLLVGACAAPPSGSVGQRSLAPPPGRWSGPLYLHGTPFYFQIGAETPIRPLFGADEVLLDGFRISYRYQRFWIQGRPVELPEGRAVFLYRPPGGGKPWRRRAGNTEIVWKGDGTSLPIELRDSGGGAAGAWGER